MADPMCFDGDIVACNPGYNARNAWIGRIYLPNGDLSDIYKLVVVSTVAPPKVELRASSF